MNTWHKHYSNDLELPKSWIDESYGNDVCPSWVYKDYRIFINHYNKNERTDDTNNKPRFTIFLNNDYINCNEPWLYITTNKFSEVLKTINQQGE